MILMIHTFLLFFYADSGREWISEKALNKFIIIG